jgi:hypothetical protein
MNNGAKVSAVVISKNLPQAAGKLRFFLKRCIRIE